MKLVTFYNKTKATFIQFFFKSDIIG